MAVECNARQRSTDAEEPGEPFEVGVFLLISAVCLVGVTGWTIGAIWLVSWIKSFF